MPRKPIDNAQCAAVLEELLDHIFQAERHLTSAAKRFEKLPRALPARRMDKVCATTNQLCALRSNIFMDAQQAKWCDDDLATRLRKMQERFQEETAEDRPTP